MKNRFFSPEPLTVGTTVDLDDAESHHARVLRVREREEVEVFDSTTRNFAARVASIGKDRVALEILAAEASRESNVPLTLALALIHPEKFELVLQKGTELGIHAFIPILSEHCEVRPERVAGKRERWDKIVLEAVKQSGRSRVPSIALPLAFVDAMELEGPRVLFDASATPGPFTIGTAGATLFIGPEGGWSESEVELARRSGARLQQLGPRRLRAETAAIAAVVAAGSLLGDLSLDPSG